MKTAIALLVAALLAGTARAEWKDLKPGMDQAAALHCVGMPLMLNRGRGGAEVWTYDYCGYIQFQYGRVAYFEPSKPVIAKTKPVGAPKTAVAVAKAPAQKAAAPQPKAKTSAVPNVVAVSD
jgi:hypothetical protein